MARPLHERPPVRGSLTALVTPFRGGEVDWACVDKLVDRQLGGGTDWLVPLGTTGESPTLTQQERERLLDAVIARADGRCPVMAGTGSNDTAKAVEWTRQATASGADAVLVVAPYYNRPTPEGLYRHFAKVAEATELPIVLYDVPARTGVRIGTDVVARLRQNFANVRAIKDATATVDHVTPLRERCGIDVLCGDDVLTWPFISLGAVGAVTVLGNLVPDTMKQFVDAALAGRLPQARDLHVKLFDLAMGISRYGPNPLPIKTAMSLQGLLAEEFRLPLCPLDDAARQSIAQVLHQHGLLEKTAA